MYRHCTLSKHCKICFEGAQRTRQTNAPQCDLCMHCNYSNIKMLYVTRIIILFLLPLCVDGTTAASVSWLHPHMSKMASCHINHINHIPVSCWCRCFCASTLAFVGFTLGNCRIDTILHFFITLFLYLTSKVTNSVIFTHNNTYQRLSERHECINKGRGVDR